MMLRVLAAPSASAGAIAPTVSSFFIVPSSVPQAGMNTPRATAPKAARVPPLGAGSVTLEANRPSGDRADPIAHPGHPRFPDPRDPLPGHHPVAQRRARLPLHDRPLRR